MTHHRCCCLHVKTCAKIISILGIIGSLFIFATLFLLFNWIPLVQGLAFFITYIFVLYGVIKERPHLLLPAQIVLGLDIIIGIGLLVTFIVFEIIFHYNAIGFAFGGLLLILLTYTVFAFIVIHRSRKYLLHHLRCHC